MATQQATEPTKGNNSTRLQGSGSVQQTRIVHQHKGQFTSTKKKKEIQSSTSAVSITTITRITTKDLRFYQQQLK
jgi:hypothetical protein